MGAMASQITSLTIVYSNVYSDTDQSKHQSSASLAFVSGIHRWPVISRTHGQWRGKGFHLTSSWWKHWFKFYVFFILFFSMQTWQTVCWYHRFLGVAYEKYFISDDWAISIPKDVLIYDSSCTLDHVYPRRGGEYVEVMTIVSDCQFHRMEHVFMHNLIHLSIHIFSICIMGFVIMGFLSDSGHARAVMHAGIANSRFSLKSVAGKTFLTFPAHARPAVLCIW